MLKLNVGFIRLRVHRCETAANYQRSRFSGHLTAIDLLAASIHSRFPVKRLLLSTKDGHESIFCDPILPNQSTLTRLKQSKSEKVDPTRVYPNQPKSQTMGTLRSIHAYFCYQRDVQRIIKAKQRSMVGDSSRQLHQCSRPIS